MAFVLLSSASLDAAAALAAAGLPAPALHLCRDDLPDRAGRGSGVWLQSVAERLHLRTNQLLLVGTSEWDWRTGINAGIVHVHARWANHVRDNKGMITLCAGSPADVRELLDCFFLNEPGWVFSYDAPGGIFKLRSLLPPRIRLPRAPGQTFELQDVFTRGQKITVGGQDARDLLMQILLSSAYLDGTLPGRSYFCVYPSSTPDRVSPELSGFLDRAKSMVGSWYKEDLLERVSKAPDTSLERWRRRTGQSTGADISIAAQTRTVRVSPQYKGKLTGKTVVVFDDFTTEGTSIEWARTLLTGAGAAQVIALTVGKYGSRHTVYQLHAGTTIDPFAVCDLGGGDFLTASVVAQAGQGPEESVKATMGRFISAGA